MTKIVVKCSTINLKPWVKVEGHVCNSCFMHFILHN